VDGPVITVCVSTRNRAGLLPQLVARLEAQTIGADSFEVVIVDDGSTDDTWQVLQDLAAASPLTIRTHRNESSQGPAAGRNRAWRDAGAPLCAFTDDDCIPTPGWLEAAVSGLSGRNAAAAGRIMWPPYDEQLLGPFSRSLAVSKGNARWGATANLIVQTEHLRRVDGFDESFRFPAGEDTDLLLRILETDVDFAFLTDALVYHRVEPAGLRALLRDQRRWADIPAVIAKHPGARRALLYRGYYWREAHPRTLLLVAGLLASPITPLASLLAVPWVHDRLCHDPVTDSRTERVMVLPGRLVLDLVEIATMVRGSIKHKTLVL
jgi:glycosyltransferase involved in cell wall biosynthesis